MDFRFTQCVFLGYSPSHHAYRCLDISTERLYITRHVRFNEAQCPFDIPKTASPPISKTSPHYSSESPYVIPTTDHPSPSSPSSPSSSPLSVSHLSLTSQTSPESSNGHNKGTIDNIICQLRSAFLLKDLGPLNYFLGIEIVSHVSGILLSKKKSILELLQSVGLSNCNLVSSPMLTSSSLSLDDNTIFFNPVKYRQVVGSLQYVTLSRPDMAFAVNKVCQYMHAPIENHWSAVKRILRYLHGTAEHDDRRSTREFAIYLGSNLISWTARKQRTISCSSQKAEYKDLADIVVELTWLQALLNELGICSSSTPILWCDNLGNNKGTIDNVYCQLRSAFALKDLGPLNYFLGIEIVSHVSDILLSQKKSILELLQSVGLSNCNLVSSPMLTSSSLSLDDSTAFFNPVKYRQVVGSLQYVTLSRPAMAFAVNKVCQYMHAPTENHWSPVKRILRYLHGTVEHGMLIRHFSSSTLQAFTNVLWKGNFDTSLKAFSDADWLEIQMIDGQRGNLLYILVQTLYLGPLVNNVRFHVPLHKPNTRILLTLLLSSHGFKLFLMSLEYVHLQLLYDGVTILVQHTCQLTLSFMRVQNT
nr:hypothetical protein [Tanacetum cinerariifolium]